VDPDWLFDSMVVAGLFRSSFNDDHHHTVDDAAAASEISSFGRKMPPEMKTKMLSRWQDPEKLCRQQWI
jgi:hypothetical protein